MSLADEIDGPATSKKGRPRAALRVRHLVYAQVLATIGCVAFGQCERWGYARFIEPNVLFGPIVLALLASPPLFPIAMIVFARRESPRRLMTWLAIPLSLAMSATQVLAIFPLVS